MTSCGVLLTRFDTCARFAKRGRSREGQLTKNAEGLLFGDKRSGIGHRDLTLIATPRDAQGFSAAYFLSSADNSL